MIASSGGEKIASEDRVVRRLIAYSTSCVQLFLLPVYPGGGSITGVEHCLTDTSL